MPEGTAQSTGEQVVQIPLDQLHPFPNHPFKVRDDDAMRETTESIKEYGVLVPAIVRPREERPLVLAGNGLGGAAAAQIVSPIIYREGDPFDDLDAPPVIVGAQNWITPPFEFDHYFFPQASWMLDAIHQQIVPLPDYVPSQSRTETEQIRKAKAGV